MTVTNGIAMATVLLKSTLPKFEDFQRKWHFSPSNRIHIGTLVQNRNQRPEIDPSTKFQPNWTKDKRARILALNYCEN